MECLGEFPLIDPDSSIGQQVIIQAIQAYRLNVLTKRPFDMVSPLDPLFLYLNFLIAECLSPPPAQWDSIPGSHIVLPGDPGFPWKSQPLAKEQRDRMK